MLAAVLLAVGVHPAPAGADGDPASDYLLEQQVFLPAQLPPASTASQQRLLDAVREANRKGFRLRVAVISSSYDLGSVTQLWSRPQTYARFLGIELSLAYKGRLLVVMPNGFGFNWPGHPQRDSEALLERVPIRAGDGGELEAATAAVSRLAAAAGVSAGSGSARPARAGGGVAWELVAGAGLALLLLGGRWLLRRRPRGRIATGSPRMRWAALALPALALLAAVASLSLVVGSSRGSAQRASRHAAAEPPQPAAAWSAGQRPAPEFRLTDQNGHRVGLAAYRGRPVLITFIDPLCRNLCPLEAHVLNQLDRSLPAAQRPEIIAVSVDIYADARSDLLQDYRKWSLVPQWRWAVGTPSALASVWRRYAVEVDVETKRIAGTTVHYIGHDEMAYLIDPRGYERALFLWPYRPAQVLKTLRRLRS